MANDSTFNELVTEISTDERERMLSRMRKGKTVVGNVGKSSAEQNSEDEASDLSSQLKRQSIFLQIWYWIKAAFSNSSVEDVFNKALVNGMARDIERTCPGLIDYRKKLLCTAFYERFSMLKKAADFFAPYLDKYDANQGAFYTLLGYLVAPEVGTEIEHQADPYQYALDKTVTNEMKALLVQKMDRIIDDISNQKKSELYAAVRGVEWLKQFVKLPFSRVISKFIPSSESGRDCSFAQVKSDFSEFARILSNYVPLTDEAVQALYLFSQRGNKVSGFDDANEENSKIETEFVNNAANQNGVIKMFVQTVPMYKMAKVVFENSMFMPDAYSGGESWFLKYRNQWKLNFERRWNNWERDCKKEKLKVKLLQYFHLTNFPLLTFRPWDMDPNPVVFHYELTMGFINYFFKSEFVLFSQTLAMTAVEGEFALRDNRFEFSDTINGLTKLTDEMELLSNQLSAGGEYGQFFAKIESKSERSNVDEVKIDGTMTEIEEKCTEIINGFGKYCRSLKKLLGGILSEKITAYYGPLINFMKINGKENKTYREKMGRAKFSIDHAYELLQEIEPLDLSIES